MVLLIAYMLCGDDESASSVSRSISSVSSQRFEGLPELHRSNIFKTSEIANGLAVLHILYSDIVFMSFSSGNEYCPEK